MQTPPVQLAPQGTPQPLPTVAGSAGLCLLSVWGSPDRCRDERLWGHASSLSKMVMPSDAPQQCTRTSLSPRSLVALHVALPSLAARGRAWRLWGSRVPVCDDLRTGVLLGAWPVGSAPRSPLPHPHPATRFSPESSFEVFASSPRGAGVLRYVTWGSSLLSPRVVPGPPAPWPLSTGHRHLESCVSPCPGPGLLLDWLVCHLFHA